jgi:preprotein translocase subunit YajC
MLELISSLFVSDAFAQATDAVDSSGAMGNGFRGIIPLLVIFAVFYFLILRPQQKKIKQHQNMVKALKRGDKIVTGGGIIGTVTKVDEDAGILDVDIANGVIVKIVRSTVSDTQVRAVTADEKEPEKKADKKEKK